MDNYMVRDGYRIWTPPENSANWYHKTQGLLDAVKDIASGEAQDISSHYFVEEIMPDMSDSKLTIDGSYPITSYISTAPNLALEIGSRSQPNTRKPEKVQKLCLFESQDGGYIAQVIAVISKSTLKLTVKVYTLEQESRVKRIWETEHAVKGDHAVCSKRRQQLGYLENFCMFGIVFNNGRTVILDIHFGCNHQHLIITPAKSSTADVTYLPPLRYHGRTPAGSCKDLRLSNDEKSLYFLWCEEPEKSESPESSFVVQKYSTRNWQCEASWTLTVPYPQKDLYIRFLTPLYSIPQVCMAHGSWDCITVRILNEQLETYILPTDELGNGDNSVDGFYRLIGSQGNLIGAWREATFSYWDRSKSTSGPIASCNMESFYCNPMRDENDRIIHAVRFSPGGQVITFITASGNEVHCQSVLAFNLQLIDSITIFHEDIGPTFHIWSIAISPTCGVAITGAVTGWAPSTLFKIVFCRIKGLYERITQIEQYFDSWGANRLSDAEEVGRWEVQLSEFHRGNLLKGSSCSISKVFSTRDSSNSGNSSSSADDWREQLKTAFNVNITHLYTYTYPWDSSQLVHVFALLGSEVLIVAIRIGTTAYRMRKPFVMRTLGTMGFDLYNSGPQADISLKRNGSHEWIEFRRRGDSEQDDSAQDDSVQGDTPMTRQMNNQISLISELHHPADLLSDFVALMRSGGYLKEDEAHLFLVQSRTPSLSSSGENSGISNSSNFMAFFNHVQTFQNDQTRQLGHRQRSDYAISKLLLWIRYCINLSTRKKDQSDVKVKEFFDAVANHYDAVFDDREFDHTATDLVPCCFAGALALDSLTNKTMLTDQFLVKYHEHVDIVWRNSPTISACLPLACHIRPLGVLSLLRHFCTWTAPFKDTLASIDHKSSKYRWPIKAAVLGANATVCAVPLFEFCSYHRAVPQPISQKIFGQTFADKDYEFWLEEIINARIRNDRKQQTSVRYPASPFTCLIDQISGLENTDLMLAFFEIPWMEKLLLWKLDTFATRIFISRLILPMLVMFFAHISNCLLVTLPETRVRRTETIIVAMVQLIPTVYLTWNETRQYLKQPGYFGTFYNYFDWLMILLSYAMTFCILADIKPPTSLIALSSMIIWFNVLLQLRIYQPVGVLLIVITDMIKGIGWFLLLLGGIVLGFSFVPFFIFRTGIESNNNQDDTSDKELSNFPVLLTEMIKFLGGDFDALDSYPDQAFIRITRTVFTIAMSVLLINVLIALLNLEVEETTRKGQLKWLSQTARLIVDIERYLLTSSERIRRRDWFPIWFQYTLTEMERRKWEAQVKIQSGTLGWPPEADVTTKQE